jgi:hypothetical protein
MRRDLEKRLAKLMPAGAGVVETFVFINAPTAAAYRAEQLRLEATGVNGLFVHEGESGASAVGDREFPGRDASDDAR